jgi:hypothetical protein
MLQGNEGLDGRLNKDLAPLSAVEDDGNLSIDPAINDIMNNKADGIGPNIQNIFGLKN